MPANIDPTPVGGTDDFLFTGAVTVTVTDQPEDTMPPYVLEEITDEPPVRPIICDPPITDPDIVGGAADFLI